MPILLYSAFVSLSDQNVLEQMALRKESTMDGCLNTLAEGSSLIEQLRLVARSPGCVRRQVEVVMVIGIIPFFSFFLSRLFAGWLAWATSAVGQSAESDATGSFNVIETSMERLNQLKEEVLTLWNDQNVKLELYIQWKMWERDSLEVSDGSICPL